MAMPFGVTVLHRIATDDMGWLEAFLHRLHRRKRVRGEWFRLDPADVDGITAIVVCDRPAVASVVVRNAEGVRGRVYKQEVLFDLDDYRQVVQHNHERAR